mgnify:CR=1 FL=1
MIHWLDEVLPERLAERAEWNLKNVTAEVTKLMARPVPSTIIEAYILAGSAVPWHVPPSMIKSTRLSAPSTAVIMLIISNIEVSP